MKLTAKGIRGLQLPEGKMDHLFWDDDIPGFGLRLRAGGSRSWVLQYTLGDKQRRLSLGTASAESFSTVKDSDGRIKLGIRDQAAQLHAFKAVLYNVSLLLAEEFHRAPGPLS